ncbi:unnamed protein product [Didymodactylos carnosus]|uniref:Retrotransposon gag domain-containing protein n=1 Tax=Didymodactylos carnosus TaxID=1234261 RepID=A0A814BV05_9BILA|nr:unnamed protein product [Didymodactylos carnosus]CAF0934411.1 unnamed protein product [Didymodactylos carnosus]CAF3679837.1 unnamed protein product [Didymodactylos carnosus]CAF3711882.1 unnamed protein product [Didymodactylos carnosus]
MLIQHLTSPEDQNENTTQITTQHSTTCTILRDGGENDEKVYDDFLRNNFTKFSGGETEDPEPWLLEILATFESLKVLESEWLSYVSALLILKAPLWYGKHKSKFKDFDNFVEKFTIEFRPIERIAGNHTPTTTSTSDHTTTTTKKHPLEFSLIKTYSEQVVKNLKKFSDKKEENVMRWLNDMQVQFDANVKQEYGSKFKQQQALERMHNYKQTTTQSVNEFYHGILDICRDFDPNQTEPPGHNQTNRRATTRSSNPEKD